jgi:hypothetical protein
VGLEPTTPCLKGRCSNQLSYGPINFLRDNETLELSGAPNVVYYTFSHSSVTLRSLLKHKNLEVLDKLTS